MLLVSLICFMITSSLKPARDIFLISVTVRDLEDMAYAKGLKVLGSSGEEVSVSSAEFSAAAGTTLLAWDLCGSSAAGTFCTTCWRAMRATAPT